MGHPKLEFALNVVKKTHLIQNIINELITSSTTIPTTAIPVTAPPEKTDSLTIEQKPDGSYEINWDKEDPMWKFLNHLTSAQIQVIMKEAIQDRLNQNDA